MAIPNSLPTSKDTTALLENWFGSAKALKAAERALNKMLSERGIYFGEGLLPTYAFAFTASQDRIARWAEQSEMVVAAAEYKVHQLIEESINHDTQLGREANELIYTYPGYDRICVLCRPEGIPVGSDLRFVELNCDSPAMMMFLDIVAECLLQLDELAPLRDRNKPMSTADQLLEALVGCYREYGGTEHPTIAIADWEQQKTRYEHQRIAEHFEARGYPTVVCDPRTFTLAGGKLHTSDGRRVHIVYRRALASEIIERRDSVAALLTAYRDGTVCMVNPLRSYVASAKSLLTHLGDEDLPEPHRAAARFIPKTVVLDAEMREIVQRSPDRWALKKSESHGGMNVILPDVSNATAWRNALASAARETWIAQAYLEVPRLALPMADGDHLAWVQKFFNWNPFVFAGRYAGGLVRVSTTPLINITLGGGLLPTLVV